METLCRGAVHTYWLLSGRKVSRLFPAQGCLTEGRGKLELTRVSKLGGEDGAMNINSGRRNKLPWK